MADLAAEDTYPVCDLSPSGHDGRRRPADLGTRKVQFNTSGQSACVILVDAFKSAAVTGRCAGITHRDTFLKLIVHTTSNK
jgi:hypothetical protein